jgi:hypothetical protein
MARNVPPLVTDGRVIDTEFGPKSLGIENLGADPAAPQNGSRIYTLLGGVNVINPAGTMRSLTPRHLGSSVGGSTRTSLFEENYLATVNNTATGIIQFQMPVNSGAIAVLRAIARQPAGTGAGDTLVAIYTAGVKRHGSGSGAEIAANTPFYNRNDATWAVSLAHTGGGLMEWRVTGDASNTVEWWAWSDVHIFSTSM